MFHFKSWTIWSGKQTLAIHNTDRRCIVTKSEDELSSFLEALALIEATQHPHQPRFALS